MSEKNNVISPELWAPLEQEEKNAEKMERPSLTFLQDGWRRLKSNKIAILSLIVIALITIGAIFIPMFWKYDYKTQNLELANIPDVMKVYPLDNGKNIYVTPQYTVVVVDKKGNLEGLAEVKNKDVNGKKNFFTVGNSEICVDYSGYSDASKEYKKLEKKAAKKDLDTVAIKGIKYLENYYAGSDVTEVTIEEAKSILENKIERTVITCDGEKLTKQEKIKNKTYLLGTDGLGRDLFIRIVYGARISLLVGLFAAFINFVVGVFYGAIAGYCGGTVDNIMMRITDILYTIPDILLIILLGMALKDPLDALATKPGFKWMQTLGPNMISIFIIFALLYWVGMARIVRSQILILKESEYVTAARALGASSGRIIKKHLLTNCIGTLIVTTTLQIPASIFTESYLSFIGLGVAAPLPSLGSLATDAVKGMNTYPHLLIAPALMISVMILVFNLFGDGLRDAFDPKLKN
mgnify:CR=1 FL=1